MISTWRSIVCLTPLFWWWGSAGFAAETPARPNIIFIMTDDQGYGDLSCHGNPILKTPHLDRLHGQSVRFTDYNVSPTCSPTRCALLTGRHEFRSGVCHTIMERERMALTANPYPVLLKQAGYATAIFGKWHLGDEVAYQPDKRGFGEVFIHGAGGIGQTFPGSCGDAPRNSYFNPAILHNGQFEKTKGYCTDVFFNQAIKWIDQHRDQKSGPFYAHLCLNAPHDPLDCPEEYIQQYAGKVPEKQARFFGMIANIDDNIGRLMAKLQDWKLDENTIVIFTTDNGSANGVNIFNAGMRGSKVTPFLGGIRVPFFVRWTQHLTPHEVSSLAAHIDLFPTICELTGIKIPEGVQAKLEGRSLVPLLNNAQADWPDRILVTHAGRWAKGKSRDAKYQHCSIRNSRFQMVRPGAKDPRWMLFDLNADPGETTDVSEKFPLVVKELDAAYDRWWESILPDLVNEEAVGPTVNPFKELYWQQFPDERPEG